MIMLMKQIEDHVAMVESLSTECLDVLKETIALCVESIAQGGTIYFCGNGGSAADAQHLAAEFVVRFRKNRKALKALALTTDTSALTACGNDYGYEYVFARQLEAFAKKGDVIFLISTSGTSSNVVKAKERADELGLHTVAVTGDFQQGIGSKSDYWWRIPSTDTARIQEGYMLLGHLLCGEVEGEVCADE